MNITLAAKNNILDDVLAIDNTVWESALTYDQNASSFNVFLKSESGYAILATFLKSDDHFITSSLAVYAPYGYLVTSQFFSSNSMPIITTAQFNSLVSGTKFSWKTFLEEADIIEGSEDSNIIYSGGESDYVYGRGGNDFLYGQFGDDSLYGNDGDDVLYGGFGNDNLDGNEGDDFLYGEGGDDNLYGNEGDDFLYGGGGDDYLIGKDGDDVLFGDDGDDELWGGLGNNIIDGGQGKDSISYRDLSGFYSVDAYLETITINLEDGYAMGSVLLSSYDNISLSSFYDEVDFYDNITNIEDVYDSIGDDEIYGDENSNTIFLSSGFDKVYAGGGDDEIVAGTGFGNIYDGEEGSDTLYISSNASLVSVNLNLQTQYDQSGSGLFNKLYNIEILTLDVYGGDIHTENQSSELVYLKSSSPGILTITGDNRDWISYKQSANSIYIDMNAYAAGFSQGYPDVYFYGVESVEGSIYNDIIYGNALDNHIRPGLGSDLLYGSLGSDTIDYSDSARGINANLALKKVSVGEHSDFVDEFESVIGSKFKDTITGDSTKNKLFGLEGNDLLNGRGGADHMEGGLGNDTYEVENSSDITLELTGQGVDHVRASISHTLQSNLENLTLTGSAAINGTGNSLNNILTGNTGANTLNGELGNDTLNGGSGNDKLYGGLGNDRLTGGAGSDLFVFNSTPNATSNRDTITDFNVRDDTIQLENSVFTALGSRTGILNATMFKTGTNNAAGDESDRIIYNQSTGALFYDADGTGASAAVQIALIGNQANLTVADFVVI